MYVHEHLSKEAEDVKTLFLKPHQKSVFSRLLGICKPWCSEHLIGDEDACLVACKQSLIPTLTSSSTRGGRIAACDTCHAAEDIDEIDDCDMFGDCAKQNGHACSTTVLL